MRFSDLCQSKLVEAKEHFGTYGYEDKGPHEVMDIFELLVEFEKLSVEDAAVELKHLAHRTDCPLDPEMLVNCILQSLDVDERYESFGEDEELMQYL